MDHIILGSVIIGFCLALLIIRVPVAVALALPSMIGVSLMIDRWDAGPLLAVSTLFRTFTTDAFIVIPMFVFMGTMAFHFALVFDLFEAAQHWLGRFRGGLLFATVLGAAGFAAVTGSSAACTAAVGRTALPELLRAKYSESFAAATVAASGTLGLLIPPSTVLVIYAILSEQSVAAMLLAGVIPGVFEAIVYVAIIRLVLVVRPKLAPPGKTYSLTDTLRSTRRAWPVPLVFFGVTGGIAAGIWTPTEAGAAGAVVVLIVGVSQRRVNRRSLTSAISEAATIVGATFPIVAGAFLLGRVLALTGMTNAVLEWAIISGLSPMSLLFGLLGLYLLLGMIMEGTSILALTVPLVVPIMMELGFDGVWLGIIITKMVELALITPPVGLNVFTLKAVWPSLRNERVFISLIPFFVADVVLIGLLIALPQLVTFLPTMVLG